ncbi:hypothetical protein DXG01_010974 [Tephrocybe rancida]|nr:hypothetical protein DXG01_010974 [Tephrocybe rancida]
MSSEETLVEGGRVDANAVFTFSRDDMRRTTLSLRGYGPCYTVDSDMGYSRTNISRYGESAPLAVSETRGILPDKITFSGKERQRLRSWLKFSTLTLFPVTFEANGRTFIWRSTADGKLSLHTSSPITDSPIAWFTASRALTINGITSAQAAYLTLRPEAIEIQDAAIISFLILEHKSRISSPPPQGSEGGQYVYYCESAVYDWCRGRCVHDAVCGEFDAPFIFPSSGPGLWDVYFVRECICEEGFGRHRHRHRVFNSYVASFEIWATRFALSCIIYQYRHVASFRKPEMQWPFRNTRRFRRA